MAGYVVNTMYVGLGRQGTFFIQKHFIDIKDVLDDKWVLDLNLVWHPFRKQGALSHVFHLYQSMLYVGSKWVVLV